MINRYEFFSRPVVVTPTNRFRDAFSKDVEANVIYTVKMLCEPLLALFVATMARVKALAATPNADAQLVPLVRAVGHIMKLFYSLNFVVLPQLVEDNMVAWFNEMQWLLQWTSTSAKLNEHASFETKPGPLLRAQALVLDAVTLFAQKYEEEIQPFLQAFVSDAWQLLTRASADQRDDRRVIAAMTFLQTIAQSVHHDLFNNADTLKQICENVIIPNIMLRGNETNIKRMRILSTTALINRLTTIDMNCARVRAPRAQMSIASCSKTIRKNISAAISKAATATPDAAVPAN